MICYRDVTGFLHRTQAEAKASGKPFQQEIVPNDQKGLIDYINGVRAEVTQLADTNDGDLPTNIDEASPYRNGDPTRPFMGSRDPSAIFTCTTCGANNRNP